MINGIAFDLGSTLICFNGNWSQVMTESRDFLARELTLAGLDIDEGEFSTAFGQTLKENMERRLQDNIERPMSVLLIETLKKFGLDGVDQTHINELLGRMYSVSEAHWEPVDGLHGVLDSLQADGYPMGVISNAADSANVDRLIDKMHIRKYFDPILVSAAVGIRKPDQRIFDLLISTWGERPDQLVMVGDSLHADIRGAQSAGMQQIWIKSCVDPEDLDPDRREINPTVEVDTLLEVPEAVQRLREKG